MNINELEALAKDAQSFGVEKMRVVGSVPAETILRLIELVREMGGALEAVYTEQDDWFNRAAGVLGDYKELTK
jgi:hypothetical protein